MYQGLKKQKPAQLDALKELVDGWSEPPRTASKVPDCGEEYFKQNAQALSVSLGMPIKIKQRSV